MGRASVLSRLQSFLFVFFFLSFAFRYTALTQKWDSKPEKKTGIDRRQTAVRARRRTVEAKLELQEGEWEDDHD